MKKELIRQIVDIAVIDGIALHDRISTNEAVKYIQDRIYYQIQNADLRKEALKECFDKWLESTNEKDFAKWMVDQLKFNK